MITLERVKAHSRLDEDDTTEDAYLASLVTAATAWVKNYLGDNYPDDRSSNTGLVEAAELILIGELYENREITIGADTKRSKTFLMLLEPLRNKSVS